MAVDMFLKIDGVEGESEDDAHANEIDVLAWSWGMSQSGTLHAGKGGGGGKAAIQDVSITKWVDSSTPILMKYCASGQHIKNATLVVRKAGGSDSGPLEYVVIKMGPVLVSSVSSGGSGGEDRLTENVSLNFKKVQYDYTPQDETGAKGNAIPWKFDISANKEF